MSTKKKGRKPRTPRLARTPITAALRDMFGIHLHTAQFTLRTSPSAQPFDQLAGAFNVLQVALQGDKAHAEQARTIEAEAVALGSVCDTVCAGKPPPEAELEAIRVAAVAIENLLGRLDVSRLYLAVHKLRAAT